MNKSQAGFTIVELLIVIVIIAILAVISIVIYDGIRKQANDSAVRTDLLKAARIISMYKSENSLWPTIQQLGVNSPRIKLTKSSYDTQGNSVLYCRNSDGSQFALLAKSRSGKAFYINHNNLAPIDHLTAISQSSAVDCPRVSVDITNGNIGGIWIYTSGNGWVNFVD